MDTRRIGPTRGRGFRKAPIVIALLVLLFSASTIAGYVIEYEWWKEMGQTETWLDMLWYGLAPVAAATIVAFAALFTAHALGMRFAGVALMENRTYAKVAALGLAILSYFIAAGAFDNWTVVRYIASRGLPAEATGWRDPAFGSPLSRSE